MLNIKIKHLGNIKAANIKLDAGLDNKIFKTNDYLSQKYSVSEKINYISLSDYLCNSNGCKAILDLRSKDLLLVDYGHLSPNGSLLIGKYIINKLMEKEILN